MRRLPLAALVALALAAAGCSTVYYAAMAQLGWAKHDLLAQRVQLARDSLEQARRQFADALPLFSAGAAADVAALRASYDECADGAALVQTRIAAVTDVGEPFFAEWRDELAAASPAARLRDQPRYDSFRLHYERVLAAMRDAQAAMPAVLDAMRAHLAARDAGTVGAAAPPVPAGAADLLLRNLQLAVALADQYIAELESID